MTKQEVFDKVVRHLLNQKRKSVDDLGAPAYRGEDNLKCSVGCLIADEHYSPTLEGKISYNSEVKKSLENSGVPGDRDTHELIYTLQVLHDREAPLIWINRLYQIGREYNLDTTVVDSCVF